jgi:tryptophan halogenase
MGSLPRSQLAEHVCRFRHPAPAHDPLADHFTDAQIAQALDHMREAIGAAAHARPARDFLARLARVAEPVGTG